MKLPSSLLCQNKDDERRDIFGVEYCEELSRAHRIEQDSQLGEHMRDQADNFNLLTYMLLDQHHQTSKSILHSLVAYCQHLPITVKQGLKDHEHSTVSVIATVFSDK